MIHNIGGAARQRIFEAGQIVQAQRQREAEETERLSRQARQAQKDEEAARQQATLARFAEEAAKSVPAWRRVVDEVCTKYVVAFEDLISESRMGHLNPPRQECFYRLFSETTMSMPAIGRRFHRDHTTVLSGLRKHAKINGLPSAKDVKWANGLASRMDTSRFAKNDGGAA